MPTGKTVNNKEDLINVIIPHFSKYPLLTQKWADFKLFKLALGLMNEKKHLTMEGLIQILGIKASINNGLSETLVESFPGIAPVDRPRVEVNQIYDYNWLIGFTEGDGSFLVQVRNSNNKVTLRFTLTQHSRDTELMNSLIKYLKCGNLQVNSENSAVYFVVTKLGDITDILIPLFNKYPLQGTKKLDYADFVKISFGGVNEKQSPSYTGGVRPNPPD